MNPQLQTAVQIITLLEALEPAVQAGILDIVNLWKNKGGDVAVILDGEITSLAAIAAKAKQEQA